MVAPFASLYSGTTVAVWEDAFVGLLIAALAFWSALRTETEQMAAVSWTVAVLGVWAIIASFALGYKSRGVFQPIGFLGDAGRFSGDVLCAGNSV